MVKMFDKVLKFNNSSNKIQVPVVQTIQENN